jgi:hypothetical protein|tara:strand:- start:1373 stop:1552 length:180 start_codon:yes stop_codon:yes gene_type:complete
MNEEEIMEQTLRFEVWKKKKNSKEMEMIATYSKDNLTEARSFISGTNHILQYILKTNET